MIATVRRSHDSTRASRSLETGTRVARYHDHKSLGYNVREIFWSKDRKIWRYKLRKKIASITS